MELEFYEKAIIAGVALVSPLVAGLVALAIARMQITNSEAQSIANIEQARLRSLSEARRDKIEQALFSINSVSVVLGQHLAEWIEIGQLQYAALKNGDTTKLQEALSRIRQHRFNEEFIHEVGNAGFIMNLYMPDSVEATKTVLSALSDLLNDKRTKGVVPEPPPILMLELLNEYNGRANDANLELMEQCKALVRE